MKPVTQILLKTAMYLIAYKLSNICYEHKTGWRNRRTSLTLLPGKEGSLTLIWGSWLEEGDQHLIWSYITVLGLPYRQYKVMEFQIQCDNFIAWTPWLCYFIISKKRTRKILERHHYRVNLLWFFLEDLSLIAPVLPCLDKFYSP